MFKDLSIKSKITAGLGAIVAIFLLLLALAYNNFSRLSESRQWDRHTLEVLLETNRITTSMLQVQSATRGFMLTGNETLVVPVEKEEAAARAHLARSRTLTADNPSQQERLRRLEPMLDNWISNVIQPLIDKRRELNKSAGVSQQVASAADVLNGARTVAEIRKLIDEVADEENRLLAARSTESAGLQQAMFLLLGVGGLVCLVLAAIIAYLLTNALINPLNNLTRAVGQIAAGDQGARAVVGANDELGKVAAEFNRMAQGKSVV